MASFVFDNNTKHKTNMDSWRETVLDNEFVSARNDSKTFPILHFTFIRSFCLYGNNVPQRKYRHQLWQAPMNFFNLISFWIWYAPTNSLAPCQALPSSIYLTSTLKSWLILEKSNFPPWKGSNDQNIYFRDSEFIFEIVSSPIGWNKSRALIGYQSRDDFSSKRFRVFWRLNQLLHDSEYEVQTEWKRWSMWWSRDHLFQWSTQTSWKNRKVKRLVRSLSCMSCLPW